MSAAQHPLEPTPLPKAVLIGVVGRVGRGDRWAGL